MDTHTDRQAHFGKYRSPTPDENGYQAFMDYQKQQIENNPQLRKKLAEHFEKASSIALTQSKNGIGMIQDDELRFFHREFNDRVWNHGFGSLPSSFNILEGFFKWNPELFYFELFEEEEHLFSFFDFLDFVTSNDCSNSLNYFNENVQNDLIYSYNILNEVKDITFKTKDSKEYVIGGISLIKRLNEVFMLIISGEIGDVKLLSEKLENTDSGSKTKSYLKPSEDRNRGAVKLFKKEDIWKVNVYLRIDLETKTIDSRYIQKDNGDRFSTITDDIGMFQQSIKDEKILNDLIKKQIEDIEKYEAVFEVAYKCLFLPEYFDFNNSHINCEEHPTALFNETLKSPIFKNRGKYNSNFFHKTKDVWVIDKDFKPITGDFVIKQNELKIQKEGHWKLLEPGQAGKDKNGRIIHNRTWIEKTLSWYETVASKEVKIIIPNITSQNSGFIYLMRNASHDLNLFKIGLTTKTVEERARQLSGTSSPDKFLIIHRWQVSDCILAEKIIHESLDEFRVNSNREFFKIDIEKAILVISPIIQKVNNNDIIK